MYGDGGKEESGAREYTGVLIIYAIYICIYTKHVYT